MALQGRHALVTGGGRGIGRATAAALSAAGATVTVVGRSEAPLRDAVTHRHAAGFFVADVTDAMTMEAGIKAAATARGAIDILVANAGAAESAPFMRTDPDAFRRLFEINVMGVVHSIRAVLAGMLARGFGRIVAVSSTAGLRGAPYISAYTASKHALNGLVRSLALETVKNGVTVNAVCPTYVDTDMTRGAVDNIVDKTGRTRDEALAGILKNRPMGRLVRPEEVAAAVLYFCSADAAAVTGTTLAIAGGEI
jgi:NAD(P)-dependent dehydrogenase (short-subunit alcohol dehydrogenase family)